MQESGEIAAEINGYDKDEEISDNDEGYAEKVPTTHTAALEASGNAIWFTIQFQK